MIQFRVSGCAANNHQAPKARNVIAWGIAPGEARLEQEHSAEGAALDQIHPMAEYGALSALNKLCRLVPGALPQALAFRAFGA